MRAASLATDGSEDASDAVVSGSGSGAAGEWQEKVRNLNLEKEGLNDALRTSSTSSSSAAPEGDVKPHQQQSLRIAHERLQQTHREAEQTIHNLQETIAGLQMDKDVLGHEVGGLRLERTGWEMERQRINLELQECEADRTALRGTLAELQRTEAPLSRPAARMERRNEATDEDGEGKHLPKFIRELQIEKDGLQGRLDAAVTTLRNAEEELRSERGKHGESRAAGQALRELVRQLQTDLQDSRMTCEDIKTRVTALERQLAQDKETTREIEEKLLVASTELVDERKKHLETKQGTNRLTATIVELHAKIEDGEKAIKEREKTIADLRTKGEGLKAELEMRIERMKDFKRIFDGCAAGQRKNRIKLRPLRNLANQYRRTIFSPHTIQRKHNAPRRTPIVHDGGKNGGNAANESNGNDKERIRRRMLGSTRWMREQAWCRSGKRSRLSRLELQTYLRNR
ncbi:hypothetical protein QFC20_004025 [Naganishia adeliensis]|uniref:Uncharacterized protein n=1 Tax=Naganishia adeliensis TaxID=92952 RepID=A0ACC2W664_9TREE|nr:hypothetical protein QFC20_004025 [Naganishia adeliensis]